MNKNKHNRQLDPQARTSKIEPTKLDPLKIVICYFSNFYNFVKLIAKVTCVIGCIAGVIGIFGGLAAFKYGFGIGFMTISGGLYLVVGSLFALGITYSFLAIVQAQVETRNALIDYVESQLAESAAEKRAKAAYREAPQDKWQS